MILRKLGGNRLIRECIYQASEAAEKEVCIQQKVNVIDQIHQTIQRAYQKSRHRRD